MAGIRKETGRHNWVEGVKTFSGEGFGRQGLQESLVCKNCCLKYVGNNPPVAGCPIEVDVTRLGPSQFKDYTHESGRI